jgi:beta-lactamase superfamily II metal-dependent hydrolase
MPFTLEALQANHGDALLLHWGNDRLAVIDGGPSRIFANSVRPRLEAIRTERDLKTLPISLLMVSHIDDDHVHGVLDMTRFLADLVKEKKPVPWRIETLWHNAFDDIIGNVEPLSIALGAAVAPVANDEPVPAGLGLDRSSALVMASVGQGRQLRDDARALKLPLNKPLEKLVWAGAKNAEPVDLGDGLKLAIVGPLEKQIEALRADWDKKLAEMKTKASAEAQAIAAEFVDKSVYNLSSIAVLATVGTKRMLLTGDARGDFLLDGLRELGVMKNDTVHVDLLKVPHHGSDRNVTEGFFRQVTADHYVISADGRHDNPDPKMLAMLTNARGAAEYTIHLTNRVPAAEAFFTEDQPKGRTYTVERRKDDALSVSVSLG